MDVAPPYPTSAALSDSHQQCHRASGRFGCSEREQSHSLSSWTRRRRFQQGSSSSTIASVASSAGLDQLIDPGLMSGLGKGVPDHIRHEIGRERVGTTKPFLQHTKLLLVFRTKQHDTASNGQASGVRVRLSPPKALLALSGRVNRADECPL